MNTDLPGIPPRIAGKTLQQSSPCAVFVFSTRSSSFPSIPPDVTSRLAILAVALLLAIAAAAYLRRTAGVLDAAGNSTGAPSTGTPSKTLRVDGNHHPDRLLGLDPTLQQLVIRLEDLNLTWERNRSPQQSGHAHWNNWRKFALHQSAQLETAQIVTLLTWMEELDHTVVTEVIEYRQAFFQTWASRDPDAARDHVITLAEHRELFNSEERQQWHNVSLNEVRDDYHFVLAGSAIHDPARAWATFQRDSVDPVLKILTDLSNTVPEVFSAYAAQAPEEAWRLVLTIGERKILHPMLEGYADGAPAGQDWNAMGNALFAVMRSHNTDPDNWTYEPIAARWVTEDPVAGLEWFAARATLYADDPDDPFAPDVPVDPADLPPPEDLRQLLKIDLLGSMYASHRDLTDEVVTALDRLLTDGETELVTMALSELTGHGHLDPWDTPFIDLIPGIPDPDLRNTVFLQFVQALRPRDHDPFGPSLDEPHITCEALRELSFQLDLPDDIHAETEARFREIAEHEELARRQSTRDAPVAPH